jgi:hypothetical protein
MAAPRVDSLLLKEVALPLPQDRARQALSFFNQEAILIPHQKQHNFW